MNEMFKKYGGWVRGCHKHKISPLGPMQAFINEAFAALLYYLVGRKTQDRIGCFSGLGLI